MSLSDLGLVLGLFGWAPGSLGANWVPRTLGLGPKQRLKSLGYLGLGFRSVWLGPWVHTQLGP